MQKTLLILMLMLTGITGNLYAQESAKSSQESHPGNPFEILPTAIMDEFYIRLDKGNLLHIQLSNLDDMRMLLHTDSIIHEFRNDMRAFADSLSDPLSIKRIDYKTDTAERKLIRIRQFNSPGQNYILDHGQKAALKTEQDTVIILREIPTSKAQKRYVRLTFYLNDFNEIQAYENDELNKTLSNIFSSAKSNTHWSPKNNHNLKISGSYSLADARENKSADVHPQYKGNDYLSPLLDANMQNVYQYLSPSANLGIKLVFPRGDLNHELQFGWEPMFLFEKDNQGRLRTYRNDWIRVGYSVYKNKESLRNYAFTGTLALSYLVRRKGDFFEKNTFRLELGGLKYNNITLTPVIYFHNLFKGVTPGIRLGVSF